MRNKIQDLNNHLFAQLERLGEEDITEQELEKEIGRAKAMSNIAKNLVESAKVQVEAMKLLERAGHDPLALSKNILQSGENLKSI